MTLEDFIAAAQPAADWSPYLTALWYERHGDWEQAHKIVQDSETKEAAHIHAYLHRREGDDANARYWYGQAKQPADMSLPMDEEWERLVQHFLNH